MARPRRIGAANSASNLRPIFLVPLFILAAGASFEVLPEEVQASVFPLTVVGYIVDSDGNSISGASIVIIVLDANGVTRATRDSLSGEDGQYQTELDFSPEEWDVGDMLDVRGTFASDYGTNNTVLTSENSFFGITWINITYPLKLTELTSFNLSLVAGWNFVSLPLAGYGYMASMLDLGPGGLVVGFNSTTQNYDKTFFCDFGEVDFALEDSVGYWIYSSVANTLTIGGSYPSVQQSLNIDVPDSGGWAAVGFLGSGATRWASDIVDMFSGSIDLVVKWDQALQDFTNTYFAIWEEGDFQLTTGMCYWVYFLGDGVLTYLP